MSRPLQHCAVSVASLNEFAQNVRKDATTDSVVEEIVKPRTQEKQCRYVDLEAAEVVAGPVTYFVSHRWAAKFIDLVSQVNNWTSQSRRNASDTYVWLDVFAINQHQVAGDLDHIVKVINHSEETLLVVDKEQKVLTRMWCIFEMWKTINVGRNIQALAANVPLTFLENAWGSLDINSAETGRPGDRTLILDEVDRTMSRNMLAFQIKKALLSIDLFNNIDRRVSYLYPPWVSPQNEAAFKKYGEEMQQEAIQAQLKWERNRAAAGLPSTAAE